MSYFKHTIAILLLIGLLPLHSSAQSQTVGKLAPKPLFVDPVYDGAADPVIVWNKK